MDWMSLKRKGDVKYDGPGQFPETQWTLIREARTEAEGLEKWANGYWRPAKEYLRALGCDDDEAAEITQDFFYKLMQRGVEQVLPQNLDGSFRAYLKRSIRNFLIDRRRSEKTIRRGSGVVHVSVEDLTVATDDGGPEQHFDREWVVRVMENAMEKLKQEADKSEQRDFFDAIAPFLDGREASREAVMIQFGLSSTAFRAALYRLRKRYRKLIHEEIRSTVSSDEEFQQELDYLLSLWT